MSHLAIVVDLNPGQTLFRSSPKLLLPVVDAAIALANAHVVNHVDNAVAVIAAAGPKTGVNFLYRPECKRVGADWNDAQFRPLASLELAVRSEATRLLTVETSSSAPHSTQSLVSGGLAVGLAYLNKRKSDAPRVLIITASSCDQNDVSSHYMAYMNAFFSAQKSGVRVDACLLGERDSGLLQQGAEITGGLYHRVGLKHLSSLPQFLAWIFLPSADVIGGLALPAPDRLDYRAACFCHRKLVDIGFVCSVCLSIFCKFSPICSTCHTVFKTNLLPKPDRRKRPLNNSD